MPDDPVPAPFAEQICRDILDAMAAPGAAGIALVPMCHTRAALRVWYEQGLLTLTCAACGKFTASIRVAGP